MIIASGLWILLFVNLILLIYGDNLIPMQFYDYETLPGRDPNQQSNPIDAIATNRESDGISSTSAYTTTSPRFPYYYGSVANTSDRYLHYKLYVENAASQGVATVGAGDAEIEAARLKVLSEDPDFQNPPNPEMNFTVYTAIKWNPSHFAIQEGERYRIDVLDLPGNIKQYWYDGGIRVTPEGYTSYFDAVSNCFVGMGRCRPHLKKRRRLPSANWLSLACAIGEFVRPLTEAEPGKEENSRYLPLDESQLNPTIFDVGLGTEFRASYSGQLICFANDAHMLYWNNKGQITVTVRKLSALPVAKVYDDGRLPSCDSSQVVYANLANLKEGITTSVPCNPNGGGSGWTQTDIDAKTTNFGFGAPKSLYSDLPAKAFEDSSIPQ